MKISDDSKKSAQQFAKTFKLDINTQKALAKLLEMTWQDGCKAERMFAQFDAWRDKGLLIKS